MVITTAPTHVIMTPSALSDPHTPVSGGYTITSEFLDLTNKTLEDLEGLGMNLDEDGYLFRSDGAWVAPYGSLNDGGPYRPHHKRDDRVDQRCDDGSHSARSQRKKQEQHHKSSSGPSMNQFVDKSREMPAIERRDTDR